MYNTTGVNVGMVNIQGLLNSMHTSSSRNVAATASKAGSSSTGGVGGADVKGVKASIRAKQVDLNAFMGLLHTGTSTTSSSSLAKGRSSSSSSSSGGGGGAGIGRSGSAGRNGSSKKISTSTTSKKHRKPNGRR